MNDGNNHNENCGAKMKMIIETTTTITNMEFNGKVHKLMGNK
jgi:hypothetical protein